jgi:light-regulated signal transduction histidine kinase (bacteriophytochrome)
MTTILDAANRMGVLIDDLLCFSRMGRQGLSRSQVDLNILAQEIVTELESETKGRTIDWHITGLPIASADRTLIRAALANIISNAIKFTRPRPIGEIEIGSRGTQTESIIYVRDNGVGFDMQYADKLFGVFQRLHREDEFEGTGIGLATVHRIIARHGGRTWAEGEVGHGATFYFSLPHSIQKG